MIHREELERCVYISNEGDLKFYYNRLKRSVIVQVLKPMAEELYFVYSISWEGEKDGWIWCKKKELGKQPEDSRDQLNPDNTYGAIGLMFREDAESRLRDKIVSDFYKKERGIYPTCALGLMMALQTAFLDR